MGQKKQKKQSGWTYDEKRTAEIVLNDLEKGGDFYLELNKEARWAASLELSELVEKIPYEEWKKLADRTWAAVVWDVQPSGQLFAKSDAVSIVNSIW